MRGDLVEQQDRPNAAAIGDQLGVGEHETEQERLLLSGRASRGRHMFGSVHDGKILTMRPFDGPAGGCIARAVPLKDCSEVALLPPFESNRGPRELVVWRL
jgi:hypothetical protein